MKKTQIPLGQYVKLLGQYLRPQLPGVVVLGILLMLSIGMQLNNPLILRFFIDAARESSPFEKPLSGGIHLHRIISTESGRGDWGDNFGQQLLCSKREGSTASASSGSY